MRLTEIHDAIFEQVEKSVDGQVGVWDYLPPKEQAPYVVIGRLNFSFSEGQSCKFNDGYNAVQKIHIVTNAMERHEAIELQRKIMDGLNGDLEINGVHIMRSWVSSGLVEETSDAEYYAELDFNLWVMEDMNE